MGVFCLQMMEEDVCSTCRIRTAYEEGDEEDNPHLRFDAEFDEGQVVNSLIVASELLRDGFVELFELPGVSTVSISISNTAPFFQLRSQGDSGSCEVNFPSGEEYFGEFKCTQDMCFHFKLGLLRAAQQALSHSEKTFLRLNNKGMLSLQHKWRYVGVDGWWYGGCWC